jgi:hypothetical protein
MTGQMSVCPSNDCKALNPQHEGITSTAAGNMGRPGLAGISYRCSACGCVWEYDSPSKESKVILGHYDDRHREWKPHANRT